MGNFEKRKEGILEKFDFGKVHGVMESLNWVWGDSVPSEEQLKKCAGELLDNLESSPEDIGAVSSGGFSAMRTRSRYALMFVLEGGFWG